MQNVDDIYPLSPMQELMLLRLLQDPGSPVLFEQASFEVRETLDPALLREAWQRVSDRHPILRTAFVSDGLPRPLQIVRGRVTIPWDEHDWSALPAPEQDRQLAEYMDAERRRGFDPVRAPLIRLALIRLGPKRYRFVRSLHHLLVDRWSLRIVMDEVSTVYEALRLSRTPTLAAVRPYRDYIQWTEDLDLAPAETYWRDALAGVEVPTPLPFDRSGPADGVNLDSRQCDVDELATTALRAIARRHRLTLSIVVQGAWGLLLGRCAGATDVVFGVTLSGRPADLPGVETMVGLFINNLPVRVRTDGTASVAAWLEGLQRQHTELQHFEHTPLPMVETWGEVARSRALFDSLLVFQNDPVQRPAPTAPAAARGLAYDSVRAEMRTGYPLTLTAFPGSQLRLRLTYDQTRFDAPTIERMLEGLRTLVEQIAADPDARLHRLRNGLGDVPLVVDRVAPVPEPTVVAVGSAGVIDDLVPPRPGDEQTIATIWSELVEIEHVGAHDNFFDIGGTSVLAMRSIARVEQELGVRLNPVELMTQTLRQVAASCDARRRQQAAASPGSGTTSRLRALFSRQRRKGAAPDGPKARNAP